MFEGIYTEKQRKKLISEEYDRLAESIDDLDEKRRIALLRLFTEVAFMTVTLEETRLIIQRDGIIDMYQNGATQKGYKKSAAVEVYDKMMITYIRALDQINKALPEGEKIDPAGKLKAFLQDEEK